ncbi:MAG: hypothetical protein ACE5KP_03485 [Dehalococcoidales bacterium]
MRKLGLKLKIWFIVTISIVIIGIIIRSVWQIVVIPTAGTFRIFIPLILALLGLNAIIIYLTIKPQKLKSRPIVIGIIVVATAGLMAGVTHFVHFIGSPEAAPVLSKIIATSVILPSLSAYLLLLYFIWVLRKS